MGRTRDHETGTDTLEETDVEYINEQLRRGRQKQTEQDHATAIATFKSLVEKYPFIHQAWGNMGASLAALGKREEAIQALEQALKVRPDYDLARRNLTAIMEATPEQLRDQSFLGRKAGVLDIGLKEFALEEWMDILVSENVYDIPALRDVDATLRWLKERAPVSLDQNNFLTLDALRNLNQRLQFPDPEEQALPRPADGDQEFIHFEQESQFPTVWRLRRLLDVAHLSQSQNGVWTITTEAAAYHTASSAEQLSGLLWSYLHDLSWTDMAATARPDN